MGKSSSPVSVSQTRIATPDEASRRLSALKARPNTGPVWPDRVEISAPSALFQMRTVWSRLALASRLPSGLKSTRLISFV